MIPTNEQHYLSFTESDAWLIDILELCNSILFWKIIQETSAFTSSDQMYVSYCPKLWDNSPIFGCNKPRVPVGVLVLSWYPSR